MIFSSNKRIVHDVNIKNNTNIDRVYTSKFLGVQIDSKFHWDSHINYTCKTLSKCVGILNKARRILNTDTLKTLYYTFAYPYLIYCNIVWGNAHQIHLNKLLKIQKRIIRIINNNAYKLESKSLFLKFNMLDVYQIHFYLVANFMYKYMNGALPPNFNEMFNLLFENHDYCTRQTNSLKIPLCKLDMLKRTLRYNGVIIWNKIQYIAEIINSLDVFKMHIKSSLLSGMCL